MSEYTEKAEQFLKEHNLEFRVVMIGSDCPAFCPDAEKDVDMDKLDTFPRRTHIHGKHYRCTISGQGRGHVSFDFWNSYADEEHKYYLHNRYTAHVSLIKYKGQPMPQVTAYDLLACLQKSDPGTLENFCSNFGYDPDSRKAEQTYHAVVKEWEKVQRFFTSEEISQLQEIY